MPREALDFGQHHPTVALFLQGEGIEQRRPLPTVWARDGAAVEKPLLVILRHIELLEQFLRTTALFQKVFSFLPMRRSKIVIRCRFFRHCVYKLISILFQLSKQFHAKLSRILNGGFLNCGGNRIQIIGDDIASKAGSLKRNGTAARCGVKHCNIVEVSLNRCFVSPSIAI